MKYWDEIIYDLNKKVGDLSGLENKGHEGPPRWAP